VWYPVPIILETSSSVLKSGQGHSLQLLQMTFIFSKVNFPRLLASSGRVNGFREEADCLLTPYKHICMWELRMWPGT